MPTTENLAMPPVDTSGVYQQIKPAAITPAVDYMKAQAEANNANAMAANNQAEAQGKQFATKMSQLGAIQDLTGAVLQAPPDQQEAAYQQALGVAKHTLGVDTSQLPAHFDQTFVQGMAMQSGKALNLLQAQATMKMKQVEMQNQTAQANAASGRTNAEIYKQTGNMPLPMNTQMNSGNNPLFGGNALVPGTGSYGQQPAQQGNQDYNSSPVPPGQQMTSPNQMPQIGNPQAQVGNNNQSIPGMQLSFPAQLELQKQKVQDWTKYKDELQKESSTGGDIINNSNTFMNAYKESHYTGPMAGKVGAPLGLVNGSSDGGGFLSAVHTAGQMALDAPAQVADKAATRLNVNLIPSLHTPRITQNEIAYLGSSTLGRTLRPEAADKINNMLQADAQRTQEHLKFAQALGPQIGYDKGLSESLWQQYINENPIINTKTGTVNKDNIGNWQKYTTPDAINAAIKGVPGQAVPQSPAVTQYASPKTGNTYTPAELNDAATRANTTPDALIAKYGLKAQKATQQPPITPPGNNMPGQAQPPVSLGPQSSNSLNPIASANADNAPPAGTPLNPTGQQPGQNSPLVGDKMAANTQPLTPYAVANNFLGTNAKTGTPVLEKFFQSAMGKTIDPKSTAWCAAFANSVLQNSGLSGTGSLAARSFLHYGQPTKAPQMGDIVVFKSFSNPSDSAHGHVGFYAGTDDDGNIKTLGGNQSGSVSIKTYPSRYVIGYRHPPQAQELQQKAAPSGPLNNIGS